MNYLLFVISVFIYSSFAFFIYRKVNRIGGIASPGSIFIFTISFIFIFYSIYINIFEVEFFSNFVLSEDVPLTHSISLLVALFGLFFYWLGFCSYKNKKKCSAFIFDQKKLNLYLGPCSILVASTLFVGAFLFLIMLFEANAFSNIALFQQQYRSGVYLGSGFKTGLFLLVLPPLVFIYYYILLNSERNSNIQWFILYFSMFVCIITPILLGFRIMLVAFIPGIIWIYNYYAKKISLRTIILIFIFGLLFMGILGFIRASSEYEIAGLYTSPFNLFEVLSSPFIRNNSTTIIAATLKNSRNHDYFLTMLNEPLLNLIPRNIRPEFILQTEKFGLDIMSDFFFERDGNPQSFAGLSPNPIGFSFWQGGIFGVAFYMFIIGFISRFVDMNLNARKCYSIWKFYFIINVSIFIIMQVDSPQDAFNIFIFRCLLSIPFFIFLTLLSKFNIFR